MTATVHPIGDGAARRDAEMALLSALLWGGQNQLRAVGTLTSEDFSSSARGAVFAALRDLIRHHGRLEPVAAIAEAHRMLAEANVDGVYDVLGEVVTAGGLPALADTYVRSIRDAADAARAAYTAQQILADPSRAREYASRLLDTPARDTSPVLTVSDLSDDTWRAYEAGEGRGLSTGWADLDRYLTIADSYLTVVGGWSHAGKSTWLDALTTNLAEQHGWRTLIWSPENWPYGAHHVPRFVQRHVRRPFHDGPTPRVTPDELAAGQAWVDQHFGWIDPNRARTADAIITTAETEMRRRPYQALVIDPFTEVERPAGQRLHDFVYDFLGACSAFVDRHRCHVFVVAHPRKPQAGQQGPPDLYDIADSAHWANRADVIVMVQRGDDTPEVLIDVQKVRHRNIGTRGKVTLRFDPVTWRFTDDVTDRPLRRDWDA